MEVIKKSTTRGTRAPHEEELGVITNRTSEWHLHLLTHIIYVCVSYTHPFTDLHTYTHLQILLCACKLY